jgi:hypothetical protein
LLNTFEAAIRSTYLCLKVLALLGVISIHGSQKDDENIEQGFTHGHINIKCLQEEEAQYWQDATTTKSEVGIASRPAIEPKCKTKRVPLDLRVPNKAVMIF